MQTRKLKGGQYVQAVCKELVQEGFGLSHIESEFLPYPVKPLTGFVWGVLPGESFVAQVTKVKGNHFHALLLRQQDLPADWLGKKPCANKKIETSNNEFEDNKEISCIKRTETAQEGQAEQTTEPPKQLDKAQHNSGALPRGHFYWALFNASPERVPSPCKSFTLCGGCKLLHLSYERGASYKESWLLQQLQYRNIYAHKFRRLLPTNLYRYRNHVQVHINKYKERGFYAPFSYRVQKLPRNGCLLFDADSFHKNFPSALELVRCVRSRLDLNAHNRAHVIKTWELNSEQEKSSSFSYQVAYPQGTQTNVTLPTTAFFQVNQNILPQWLQNMEGWIKTLQKEKIMAGQNISILELFSGSGFITRLLSYRLPLKSLGIDILKEKDMAQVQINNNRWGKPPLQDYAQNYICANLWELQKMPTATVAKIRQKKFDILLLNPPRGGFAPESLHYFMQKLLPEFSAPIMYSSCNGSTLARDLENFYRYGYRLQELIFMDFFPFTAHYESLALLEK